MVLPLARYAAYRNQQLSHLNLLSASEWAGRLAPVGLDIVKVIDYMSPSLVRLWDALDPTQQVWVNDRRVFSAFWRRVPADS